jgi:hypothetical protein
MIRSQLHAIAVRRRGDPDVKALLLEIKRLHEALADADDLFVVVPKDGFDSQQLTTWKRLAAAMQASRAIVRPPEPRGRRAPDPSLPDSRPLKRWRPEREVPAGNEGDRAAKRAARDRRG